MARASLRDDDPARIGRYRLTARLGSGGMGVVYLGVTGDGRRVAVKVLRPELAGDPQFRRRFDREVAALLRVRGECTVRVIEADTESARPFMVTEYAEGPSLAEYIDRYGALRPDMLYGLATGLAEALTVIHAAGIVHRDLKPSNIILTQAGPKVIDFGIAQTLDATSFTKTGMMVGSAGFMAPEQISGHPGPAADIFVWGVTVGYAATGQPPFGTGNAHAILYRVMYGDPSLGAVPEPLRPLVEAALAKDPQSRPSARELLRRLTSTSARPERIEDTPTQTILSRTWQTGPHPSLPPANRADKAKGSLLLDSEPPKPEPPKARLSGPVPPGARRVLVSRRMAAIAVSAIALAGVAVLAVVLLTGHSPRVGPLTANQGNPGNQSAPATAALTAYPGQQQRGVFQMISRIVASGNTMVTIGSQASGSVVRQQFFASSDAGKTWHLAPARTPGGGQPPLGYVAARIAGGPHGWMAEGRQALWTSQDGLSWTLAATHGITPQLPGDQIFVVTSTVGGFLAAGQGRASGGNQAVIWTSHDGLTWQRMTAAQLALTASGQTAQSIFFATSRGNDTVISDGGSGVWLSTNGGSSWTPVTVPVDHGAGNQISGVAFDGSGLIAVRPGHSASGAADGIAYFSPNGQGWQYAGTIAAAGGWSPGVVKGSDYGLVVTGQTSGNQIVAYTSTDSGATWLPTASLGDATSESVVSATVAPGSTVVVVGYANPSKISQQAVFLEANTAGNVRSVSLAGIPGGIIPEITVNSTAVAGGEQIAVGSADGYPAVWRKASDGSWALVTSLPLVSADPGLATLTSVTHGSAGWLAVGTPGPVILTSADGVTWQSAAGSIAQNLAGVAAVSAASGPAGYCVVGKLVAPDGSWVADVWWSPDLTGWTRAHDVNDTTGSSQVLAVAAAVNGFVSVGSYQSKPAVWTTADGRAWTTIVLPVPASGSTAVLQQVASKGNLVVALGQATGASGTVPFAELSVDGGASWQQVPFPSPGPDTAFTALTVGSGGFTAAGLFGAPGQQDAAVWTSAIGASWTRSPVSGLNGGGSHDVVALAPSGSAVTAIDSIQTQEGHEFVTRSLPAG